MIRTILSTPERNSITPEKIWTVQTLAVERIQTLDDLVANLEGLERSNPSPRNEQLPKASIKEETAILLAANNDTTQASPTGVNVKTKGAQVSAGVDIDSLRERLDQLAKPASESHVAELLIAPSTPDSHEYNLPVKL